jgi:hypothetical protein
MNYATGVGRSTLVVREIELPAGLLDAHVELTYLPGTGVGLRPQLRHRQGGEHRELRAQLASHAWFRPAAASAAVTTER